MKKIEQNEEAVSPVIGVILMVAITVILAAVIAAFVFGMTGNMQSQKNVAVGVKQVQDTQLQVTIEGGADVSTLKYLSITVSPSTGKQAIYYTSSTAESLTDQSTSSGFSSSLSVGQIFTTSGASLTSGADRVVVVGHFTDGTEQMLVDTSI